ncbi:MAG: hypothetical protein NZ520_03030, partial [bacterium]|nr:hypothetical protein [bacterium]
EAIPPDPSLVERLAPRQSGGQASETLQIWWLREREENLSRALERAIGALNPQRDRLMLVGLPPKGESLAPVILAGGGLSTGVLTSATTRTEGVVSDVDLAPTLLQWMGLPLRVGEHPVRVVRKDPFSTAQSLAQRYRWNAQALIPLGAVQVLGGLLAVLVSLRQVRGGSVSRRGRLLLSVAIGLLLSLPVGTVIAPYLPASNLTLYVANILLAAAGLSLLAHWGAWEQPFRAYIRACALSALVLLADMMGGQQGAKFSVYSAYALSGIRFYGVGNELMGVLVGCALAWGLHGLPALARGVLWAVIAMVLATPAWGANLGGLLTAMTGLGFAWENGRQSGKPLWARGAGWLLVGVLAAVAVMWLDSLSAQPSHLGDTWLRWQAEGWGAVMETLRSKMALMMRVLSALLAWGAAAAIGIALWAIRRSNMLVSLREQRAHLPWLVCVAAAFLFNDSGFVPAAAILSIGLGVLLTRRLQDGAVTRPGGVSERVSGGG